MKLLQENANYIIDEKGNIFSLKTKKQLKPWFSNGYLKIKIGIKKYFIHRLVASNFIGAIPKSHVVDHINNNKTDNHYQNLRICTAKENSQFYYNEQKFLRTK